MANSSLSLTELDVPALEDSLKDFMRAQPAFKDYDYDGSNMAALIRLLAYNTWKNSWYLHMVAGEGFLDSAQTRSSVVSHAKELNYTPRSARSARGRVRITFDGTQPSYVIEKGKTFSSVVRNRGLVFSVPETILVTSTDGKFSLETDLYEGRYVKDSYVVNYSDETQRFVLSNPMIDADSLTVVVYEDEQSAGDVYVRSTTLLDVRDSSRVYFLQASESGQYEVVFGDGVVGRRPADGSLVLFDYRVTMGADGNGARVFSRDFDIGDGVSGVDVETIQDSTAGAAPESIESIRYYAPRHFQVQERAVTAQDYAVILQTQFPEVRAVSAYGGEEADPPQYGKVFIALDVENVDGIPESMTDKYYEFLKKRSGLTIEPVFVEPKYTYLSVVSDVLYNVNITTATPSNISAIVRDRIFQFADDNLNDFESTLRYSRLVTLIDQAHPSIVGNSTRVEAYKRVSLRQNSIQSFEVDFAMEIFDGYPVASSTFPFTDERSVRSETFSVAGETRYVTDDGDGTLWLATDRGTTTVLLARVGSVDYDSGFLRLTNLTVETLEEGELKFFIRPRSLDVSSRRDTILAVEQGEVRVAARAVRE